MHVLDISRAAALLLFAAGTVLALAYCVVSQRDMWRGVVADSYPKLGRAAASSIAVGMVFAVPSLLTSGIPVIR